MSGRRGTRKLTTVLFTDIVTSTEVVSQLGDARWRELLARHHAVVRRELRRFRGREIDTAGDGFFATFDAPADGVRCACSASDAVREFGIEIRAGLHFGETEEMRPKVAGIAVVTASRIAALAGPSEVLVSSTIEELVAGSGVDFDDRGTQVLKGIPGEKRVFAVQAVDGKVRAQSLDPVSAAELRASVQPSRSRYTRYWVLGAAGVAVIAVALVTVGSRPPESPPPLQRLPALLRIEPETNTIVQTLGGRPDDENDVLGAVDGLLWQLNGERLIRRRIGDGTDPLAIDLFSSGAYLYTPTFGFGSAWTWHQLSTRPGHRMIMITRYDEGSGRPTSFRVPGSLELGQYSNAFRALVAGQSGVWFLNGDDTSLYQIDPVTDVVRSWPTGHWSDFETGPTQVLPTRDAIWLCAPDENTLERFDLVTHRVGERIPTVGGACPVAVSSSLTGGTSIWLLDRAGETLSELDETGNVLGQYGIGPSHAETAIGLSAFAFGSLWLPSGRVVYRFDLESRTSTPIAMPPGVRAGTVVADEPSHTVWVADCDPFYCDWIPS